MRRIILLVLAVCIASGAAAAPKDLQYVVGVGDVLQLNVWQVPSLDRQLTVRADGMIVLPMAGEMRAIGNSLQQLEEQIARRLTDFNRNVNQVSLSVTEFKSRSIYVLGRVVSPGKYAYADAINLFDLVREAGGFAEDALRTRVKVVHRQGELERVEYANVEAALNAGTIDALPMVRAGDTVIVSKRNGQLESGSDGIQVIGEVRSPAIYALEDVNDLVGVLLMAGGPSDQANLRKVRVVRGDAEGGGTVAREFNLEAYLNRGVATQNPRCEPGDTIYVPKRRGNLARSMRVIPLLLGSIGTSLGIYYSVTK